jgi:hypothetical protein
VSQSTLLSLWAAAARSARAAELRASESFAVAAALSQPTWLEPHENFAISGGLGFTGDGAAIGFTGVMRLDRNVSGFAGVAIAPSGNWAGRVGARVGW